MSTDKKILLSGIQPTNDLTLGNYFGAIKKMVEYQEKYDCVLFVADLHARTLPLSYHNYTFATLELQKEEIIKWYIASGIDLKKTKVFYQSDIKEHLDLFYFLLSHSTVGELKIMTQFKHISSKLIEPNGTRVEWMGLLCYPVLMASDILLYDADLISIGRDQTQHLELTSRIVEKINEKYKKNIFKKPINLDLFLGANDSIKIMDLQSPDKKMSKTCDDVMGVIFLKDSPEKIKEKIMKSKTDSVNKINLNVDEQPGIFNLLQIYGNIHGISIEQTYEKFKDSSYRQLKEELSEDLSKFISNIQERYKQIDLSELKTNLKINTDECRKMAQKKMEFIYKTI